MDILTPYSVACSVGFKSKRRCTSLEHLNSFPAALCITIILWTPHCYIITQTGQDLSVCSKTSKVRIDCCGVKKKLYNQYKSFMAMPVIHFLISRAVYKKELMTLTLLLLILYFIGEKCIGLYYFFRSFSNFRMCLMEPLQGHYFLNCSHNKCTVSLILITGMFSHCSSQLVPVQVANPSASSKLVPACWQQQQRAHFTVRHTSLQCIPGKCCRGVPRKIYTWCLTYLSLHLYQ